MAAPANVVSQQGLGVVSGDQLNTYVQWTNGIAQLRGIVGLPGMEVTIPGLSAAGDGGYGTFYWSAGTYTDNGTSVIVPNAAVLPFGATAGAWLRLVNGVANGGTGGTTAQAARNAAGLNIDELTVVGPVSYQILSTDRTVAHSSLTAAVTDTLPLAASVNPGQQLVVEDIYGAATGVKTITIIPSGADTVNGLASAVISRAYGGYTLISDGVSKWSYEASAGGGTVTSVTGAGSIVGSVTTSGDLYGQTRVCNGRLTLTSATPILTTTVSGATTVYFTPYNGNLVPVWNGTNFIDTIFAEVSQATTDTTKSPAAVAASSVYDIFGWVSGSTFYATRGPAWTSGTGRGTGVGTTQLTRVQGTLVNQYSIVNGPAAGYGTYLGTIASNASSTIDFIFGAAASGGTAAVLNLWNMYNRVQIGTTVTDSGASYSYSSSAWRQARASAGNKISFVSGLAEDSMSVSYSAAGIATANTKFGSIATGLNSTTTPYGFIAPFTGVNYGSGESSSATVPANIPPALGINYIAALEVNLDAGGYTFDQTSTNALSAQFRM